MTDLERDQDLIRRLVEWAKMAPSRVAKEAGLAATTITRPHKGESHTRLSRDTVAKLQARFPKFPDWDDGNNFVRSEVAGFGDRPFDEKYGSGELPAIPVVGAAMGALSFDPEQDIELTELDSADVVDTVARPASLANDKGAYALTVVGDSMWPRFRPGRRLIVSPKAPISIGDDVVVQLKGSTVQTAPTSPDRVSVVLIKELVRRSASYIELRQFNPDVTFRVDADRIAAMHRVVGEVF